MTDSLSDSDSFIVCSGLCPGFPIHHVSSGFTELFGYKLQEAAGTNCGQLIGGPRIASNKLSLNRAAELSGLDTVTVKNSLDFISKTVGEEIGRMAADSSGESGSSFAIVVNRKQSGELMVCNLLLRFRKHTSLGWKYVVGVQHDVSPQVSVGEVLRACASDGGKEYLCLLDHHRNQAVSQDKLLDSSQAIDLQDAAAGAMWRAMTDDATQAPKKQAKSARNSSPCSLASRSTASGKSGVSCSTMKSSKSSWTVKSSKSRSSAGSNLSFARAHQDLLEKPQEVQSSFNAAHADSQQHGFSLGTLIGAFQSTNVSAQQPAAVPIAAASVCEGRFLDLLEDTQDDGQTEMHASDTANDAPQIFHRSTPGLSTGLSMSVELLHKQALLNLSFPWTIADPSVPDCPVVACSSAFTALSGYRAEDIVGKNCRLLCQGVPQRLWDNNSRTACRALCAASARGTFLKAHVAGSLFDGLKGNLGEGLADGEVVCIQINAKKTGELFRCMMFLKQVQLDDEHFIVGLQARIPDPDIDPEEHDRDAKVSDQADLQQQSFAYLSQNMGHIEQALASEFWYCAGMRRQVSHGFDDDT